ncbi:uncharacterized protein LOC117645867 [Thrips palmi]|uniref:Uncharacterized protein LOC117645867 n=1 Tax=Thrips palmi TaxID=161013 RepID=A0A6P8YXG6_THRPL|nr:uncharacterized protein LOC117645867 [Thrips palmi]
MLQGWRWTRTGLEHTMIVVVLACAALPLAATVHLILTYQHETRLWSKVIALLFRLVANALVLLCFAGDELEKNSLLLTQSLFEGPWLEETPSQRYTRLNFIQGSASGLSMPVKGMGHLNRPFYLAVMEKWFSFLQVLLKVQGVDGADL